MGDLDPHLTRDSLGPSKVMGLDGPKESRVRWGSRC